MQDTFNSLFTPPTRTRQNCPVLSSWRCEHNWRPDKTVLSCLQLCSHRQLDKTRQFCRVSIIVFTPPTRTRQNLVETRENCLVSGVNTIGDQTKLSCLVCTLQLCSHRQLDKTEQFCRVSNCVHTADTDKTKLGRDEVETRQNCLVGGVNKP